MNNPPLHAVAGASGNGVYSYGTKSTFPITTAAGANFWVDVIFQRIGAAVMMGTVING